MTVWLVVAFVWTALQYSVSERFPIWDRTSDGFSWAFGATFYFSTTAGLLEVAFLIAAYFTGVQQLYRDLSLNTYVDTAFMACCFLVLAAGYAAMNYDVGHWVHTDRASTGGARPVFTFRYLEWSLCVPQLICISGRSARACGERQHLPLPLASARCTAAYVWCSWLALVVEDAPLERVVLIVLSFMAYGVCSAEQLVWAWYSAPGGVQKTKAFLLVFQVILYGVYGSVFLLALFSKISVAQEQVFYSIGDMFAKGVFAVMLMAVRQQEDMAAVRALRNTATNIVSDLKRLIDSSHEPIFGVDRAGRIVTWNRRIADLTGLPFERAAGRPFSEVVCFEDRDEAARCIKETLAGNEVPPWEVRVTNASARTASENSKEKEGVRMTTVLVKTSPKRDTCGQIIGAIGVGQDLTAVKAEAQALKEAELSKVQFMSVVSHELRSPLHGIIGLSESLADTEPSEGRSRQLRMVKNCASRLMDLVMNIMEMTGMMSENASVTAQAQNQQLSRDPVSLRHIIEDVVAMTTRAADKAGRPILPDGVRIINNVAMDLPVIEADAHRCTQVFYNLLHNACKFTRQGSITITSAVAQHRDCVEISVADTGRGISPQALERIFEPFEQEERANIREHEGIGLGLSIARQVVRRHGGEITVKSTPSGGSTFTVRLPFIMNACGQDEQPVESKAHSKADIVKADDQACSPESLPSLPVAALKHHDNSPPSALSPVTPRTPGGRNRRPVVLSVDDDIVNQTVIESTLSEEYEVRIAMDGGECLEYFRTNSRLPDVLLLDIMMPGMSGFEVCRTIREEMRLPPTVLPILMLSAKFPVGTAVAEGLRLGCNDYVGKPFDKDVLRARVRTALQIKRLHEMEVENAKHTQLLYSIMPPHIIERLQAGENMIAERHEGVTILFSDIVGWTNIAESLTTSQVVVLLNELFSAFDALTEKHGVYKVETIGDAYMCAAGHDGSTDHALRILRFGLAMLRAVKEVRPPEAGLQLQIRVGAHTGPAYTGVVGKKVPRYCFFGDTVNVSSRMESHGSPGCLHISQSTRSAIPPSGLGLGERIIGRGVLEIKGKGQMPTHLIVPSGMPIPATSAAPKRRNICTFLPKVESGAAPEPTTPGVEASEAATLESRAAKLSKDLEEVQEAAEEARRNQELRTENLEQELALADAASVALRSELQDAVEAAARRDMEAQAFEEELLGARAEAEKARRTIETCVAEATLEEARAVSSVAELRAALATASSQAEEQARDLQGEVLALEAERDRLVAACEQLRRENRVSSPNPDCLPLEPALRRPDRVTALTRSTASQPSSTRGDETVASSCTELSNEEPSRADGGRARPPSLPAARKPEEPPQRPRDGNAWYLHRLLQTRDRELQHLKLDLRMRTQQFQVVEENLERKTEEAEQKSRDLHHSMLDLQTVPRLMPKWLGRGLGGRADAGLRTGLLQRWEPIG